jgi:hypothetical protein
LEAYLPGYQKGLKNIYELLALKTAAAILNGKRLQRENARTDSVNPSTRVHDLVQYLVDLKGA